MSKRAATNQLNDRNWNDEEPPEEPGVFTPADPKVIEKRVIRTAKRRRPVSEMDDSKKTFSSFTGFGVSSGGDTKVSFSFLSNMGKPGGTPTTEAKTDGGGGAAKKDSTASSSSSSAKEDYHSKMKKLNEELLAWITLHIKKTPDCILTPVFSDYAKYLAEIKAETGESGEGAEAEMSPLKMSAASPAPPSPTQPLGGVFGGLGKSPLFAKQTLTAPATQPSIFSSFSFTGDKPFTFGNVAGPPVASDKGGSQDQDDDDESSEPPKLEVKLVKEDDSLFSQRVKVFVKKDGAFSDRGVGTLYVKESGGKHQAVVRADTVLGNILLNVLLTEAVPAQRVGKNNVMLVCVPTPDSKPPPTPVLLRVKTEEDADNLLAKIEEFKKK